MIKGGCLWHWCNALTFHTNNKFINLHLFYEFLPIFTAKQIQGTLLLKELGKGCLIHFVNVTLICMSLFTKELNFNKELISRGPIKPTSHQTNISPKHFFSNNINELWKTVRQTAVLSTLPYNIGDFRFWTVSHRLHIRVWNLLDNHQFASLPFYILILVDSTFWQY